MRTILRLISISICIVLIFLPESFAQDYKVIESTSDHVTVEFNFANSYVVKDTLISGKKYNIIQGDENYSRNPGEPWLPLKNINVGIPFNSNPKIKILQDDKVSFGNKFIIPYPESDPALEKQDVDNINVEIYSKNLFFPKSSAEISKSFIFRYAKILPVSISPYQFNPVTRELVFHKKILARIDFNISGMENIIPLHDSMTDEYLENSVVNYNTAKNLIGKKEAITGSPKVAGNYWYNPHKNYFKFYLKEKGVYRITYNELVSAGVPLGLEQPIDKLELYNCGVSVPIDVVDKDGNSLFNNDDYFQFVGYPPPPSPNSHLNIYNRSNVYWFSYEGDSTLNNYHNISGYPRNWTNTYYSNKQILHYEVDSIYERLGYSQSENIDHWYWGKATGVDGQIRFGFESIFDEFPNRTIDSNWVTIRVAMQGMTNNQWCTTDHKAYIKLSGQQIGIEYWDGQEPKTFEKKFYISGDSINIYPVGNKLDVFVSGEMCNAPSDNDEIRVNWYEFEYWRRNVASSNHFTFKAPGAGVNRLWMTQWMEDNLKIYIPEKHKLISNAIITGDVYNSVIFVDTSDVGTEYFCVADNYYLSVDSIVNDKPSNLRDLNNGADYIIITHPDFLSAAQDLNNFRSANFPDSSISNVRTMVVDINQIYDEFSYGLLDPYALKDFVKYAFENWQSPAPSYIVLFGDMSYDYRHILASSRPNFIPSIPYFETGYGEAVSDNLIVAVSGDDVAPDLAIGRLSCETIQEADLLVNKLKKYPEDPTKSWKQNVILLASGLSENDERDKGFNEASLALGKSFVLPYGYTASYVFGFPTNPEQEPYLGDGPRMRDEINKGAAIVNYYGHGGGQQWDLIFTDDDIDLLENGGRLPLVLSVTCYTAHFDNQRIFGEHFNLVENRGSIGFWGSAGLTYWGVGKTLDTSLFTEFFAKKNLIVGKAILNAKNQLDPEGIFNISQINLLTFLGDPVLKLAIPEFPDFTISSSDITITPENPLVNDTITVLIKYDNLGRVFTGDSVFVELFASSSDTSYQIGAVKRPSFGEHDSLTFTWVPVKGNLFQLTAKVNEAESITEIDHSDNVASAFFIVFNLSEPNILKPVDGFSADQSSVRFQFSDVGYYVKKQLTYFIEIDSSTDFVNPLVSSPAITSGQPVIEWQSPNLPSGIYFWRARIYDGMEYGNWSTIRSFSLSNDVKPGYYAYGKILKTYNRYNVNYSDTTKSLQLNTDPLPARPSVKTFVKDIIPITPLPDSVKLTTITTDGTFLYYGNISWIEKNSNGGDGLSRIYKIGTGYNGTVAGQYYGTFSNFEDKISNSIVYYSDGNIYVATEKAHQLTRINVSTEQIDTVQVPPGLLRWENSTVDDGPVYLNSDGRYIYNLGFRDPDGKYKYVLRILDPANGWQLVRPDMTLSGTSYDVPTGFFVFGNYIYPSEYFYANNMRRIRISDGFFEEEWLSYVPFQSYYSWCTDWKNNRIYASVYRSSGFESKFSEFVGNYIDASGSLTTNSVGPVARWNDLTYELFNPSSLGTYKVNLLGYNSKTQIWDTLAVRIADRYSLQNIDAVKYPKLKLGFSLTDSSLTILKPMELKSVNFNYLELPDLLFSKDDMKFSPDSSLQGIPITMSFRAKNPGNSRLDSVNIKFYLNGLDSLIYSKDIVVNSDTLSDEITYTFPTDHLLFNNDINAIGTTNQLEYFTFDNLTSSSFYVARDSVKPEFSITFDGAEIINGDIISANPDVMITLTDNSPLPLDESLFTIVYDDVPLHFSQDTLSFNYTPYPNSKAEIHWTPKLPDGTHKLQVLAKDASGNFFDTTYYQITFSVFNESDLAQVYNYPNPFTNDTYFTFELRGIDLPQKVKVKIYTIAGRLIRDFEVLPSELKIGFNKVYWDGRDQDNDQIANGVYLYKIIADFKDKTKAVTQKLALVR